MPGLICPWPRLCWTCMIWPQMRTDKEHFMRQADKSQEEAERLGAELSKCTKVSALGLKQR